MSSVLVIMHTYLLLTHKSDQCKELNVLKVWGGIWALIQATDLDEIITQEAKEEEGKEKKQEKRAYDFILKKSNQ